MKLLFRMYNRSRMIFITLCILVFAHWEGTFAQGNQASMRYTKSSKTESENWQTTVRDNLFRALKIEKLVRDRHNIPFDPVIESTENMGSYILKKIEINSTRGRRIKVIVTTPAKTS